MGTGLDIYGLEIHTTPLYGYPLPPPIPGRTAAQFNGNGQYRLPDPITGKTTSYTRASTVAGCLEDSHMLSQWEKRQLLIGLYNDVNLYSKTVKLITNHMAREGADVDKLAADLRNPLNEISSLAQERAGSSRAAEFGTAVHAWCEWIDLGLGYLFDVPEQFRAHVAGHRRALAENCLTVDKNWTERVVLNTEYGIAGTLDRLFWRAGSGLTLGDVKTSGTLKYSWLHFAIQMAIYHGASFVLSLDGTTWEPMPQLAGNVALISHIPRDDPDSAGIVPIDMYFAKSALIAATEVRRLRTNAERDCIPVDYALESTSDQERRTFMARYEIETSETETDMSRLWEKYEDIWTDDLTELGRKVVLSANAESERI